MKIRKKSIAPIFILSNNNYSITQDIDPNNSTYIIKSSTIPSWDDIIELFSSISDYIHSIPLENLIAFSHLLLLLILFYIFILLVIVLYGNYLIDCIQLIIRFPRLKRVFVLRHNYSRLYLRQLLICGLFLTIYHIIIDIIILFT